MNTLELDLELDGRRTRVRAPMVEGLQPVEALLPTMYAVDDAVIAATVAAQPAAVSCRKGCSACCRAQPVPVTPTEARALATWVKAQAPARRAVLEARFAERVARLQAAGLRERLDGSRPPADASEARAIGRAYHRLGLSCPFLEDEACSIHAHRPFVCRQYLVSSPASHCRDPLTRPVEVIRLPVRPAHALLAASADAQTPAPRTMPLVLALDAAARLPASAPRDAMAVFSQWLAGLGAAPATG